MACSLFKTGHAYISLVHAFSKMVHSCPGILCMFECTILNVCWRVCVCVCVCACTRARVCMRVCGCVCTYIILCVYNHHCISCTKIPLYHQPAQTHAIPKPAMPCSHMQLSQHASMHLLLTPAQGMCSVATLVSGLYCGICYM